VSRQDEVQRASDRRPGRSSVRRWLLAAGAVLVGGALLGSAPAGAGNPAGDITMVDNRFDPAIAVVAQGQSVEFTNFGQVVHDARDGTGLDLFTTDFVVPPETVTIGPLPGAGVYRYYCTFHPEMVGRVRVPVRASRTQSPAGSRVTVRWAAGRAPTGLVFDVQRRPPGTDRFVDWRAGVTAASARFRPSARGQWAIRARVRQQAGGASSAWSPTRAIRVT
jgi:plastocyanin